MSGGFSWQSQAYLDALRPAPSFEVKGAILTSYSADLVSIVAALLALAGRDNEEGSGGKADLAEAVEQLRGKVRILVQRGRLARPKRIPALAGILDQFIREINFDETERSWHPKIALVQFGDASSAAEWRLWLGSRNLTTAVNRDFGLLLNSTNDPKALNAHPVPGTGELAARLAAYAKLDAFRPSKMKGTADALRWTQPDKLVVERITLTSGEGKDKGPAPSNDIDEVFAVSPFLDGTTAKAVGEWGGPKTRRFLLATKVELAKIAGQASKPLAGFKDNVFVLESPALEPVEPLMTVDADPALDDDELEEVLIGLHAKIFAVRKAKKLRLWVGSANATIRAWTGTNVEVIAEISAPASVLEGLHALLHQARPVSAAELEALKAPEEDTAAEHLENARKRFVASWKGHLSRDGDRFSLQCEKPPHPADSAVVLEAGLATASSIVWPPGQPSLMLGQYPMGFHTQLVQFRLSIEGLSCSWLQCVHVSPPFEPERDHHAVARHLGMSAFLAWIAALLGGDSGIGDAGEPWHKTGPSANQSTNIFDGTILTLDAMLACWARDRANFKRVSARINTYLGPIIAQADAMPPGDIERLRGFQSVWQTVSGELLKDH